MKRVVDFTISIFVLMLTLPLWLVVMLGIKLSSTGPVFYKARRTGLHNRSFEMLKFRTMHVGDGGSVITANKDPRVFRFGVILRKLKIDELPQFLNVIRGEMSLVGPRPEDPRIVATAYSGWMLETLNVLPGMTGQGSVFFYSFGETLVEPSDPEGSYIEHLLPPKLALERAYMERATPMSDIREIVRTVAAIVGVLVGRPVTPDRRDLAAATEWVPACQFSYSK